MFGWLSRASAWASRANRSAKAGSSATSRRQDLQRHQPVQLLLPGLVDDAHAALAEEFQDLQLGKLPAQRFQQRRAEPAGRRLGRGDRFGSSRIGRPRLVDRGGNGRLGFKSRVEQALGTQPFGSVG